MEGNKESPKTALHPMIERITAYPDREIEVDFRIGEKMKETHGGQDLYPHDGISNPSHKIQETIQRSD